MENSVNKVEAFIESVANDMFVCVLLAFVLVLGIALMAHSFYLTGWTPLTGLCTLILTILLLIDVGRIFVLLKARREV
jgi:hypothetical protein